MTELLKDRLGRAFSLTRDLVEHLDESSLALDLPSLPSNTIAGQLWCVVGARESFLRAIAAGGWRGFSCSLQKGFAKSATLAAMDTTVTQLAALDFVLGEAQVVLAFALLEHEVQHHGQLIRYVYANRLSFPKSWNERYTV